MNLQCIYKAICLVCRNVLLCFCEASGVVLPGQQVAAVSANQPGEFIITSSSKPCNRPDKQLCSYMYKQPRNIDNHSLLVCSSFHLQFFFMCYLSPTLYVCRIEDVLLPPHLVPATVAKRNLGIRRRRRTFSAFRYGPYGEGSCVINKLFINLY